MPDRVTAAGAAGATAMVLAAFGGAYALAQGEQTAPAPVTPAPAQITVAKDPLARLGRVSPLPRLARPPAPAPPTVAAESLTPPSSQPDAPASPVAPASPPPAPVPTPAPAPTPSPAPAPEPDPAPPIRFDDSG